ncbi:MAG: M23 family metallopeptidase, partial [Pseudomonadota bacterium]
AAGAILGAKANAAVIDFEPDAEIIGAFFPQRADLAAMRKRGFFATGLQPVYPPGATCFEADSLFAVTTRGNGSRRSPRFYAGHHGGLDIPAPEGTPIVAVADGAVVHLSEGGSIGGIGVVLQHAPEETGLPVWTYTEYKHLREMPSLKIGQKVKMGEVIARAGKTGTVGTPAYGAAGHSHLHLTAWYGSGDQYRSGRMLIPLDGYWMDPLALFRGPPVASIEIEKLPDHAKKVPLPYKGTDWRVVPEGVRVVWPFVCEKK